jgi:hypothetical protein
MAEVTYFVALPSSLPTMALRLVSQPNASIQPLSSCGPRHYHANLDILAL